MLVVDGVLWLVGGMFDWIVDMVMCMVCDLVDVCLLWIVVLVCVNSGWVVFDL